MIIYRYLVPQPKSVTLTGAGSYESGGFVYDAVTNASGYQYAVLDVNSTETQGNNGGEYSSPTNLLATFEINSSKQLVNGYSPTSPFYTGELIFPVGQTALLNLPSNAAFTTYSCAKYNNTATNCLVTANTGVYDLSATSVLVTPATPQGIAWTTDDAYFGGYEVVSGSNSAVICSYTPGHAASTTLTTTAMFPAGGICTSLVWMGDDLLVFNTPNRTTSAEVAIVKFNRSTNTYTLVAATPIPTTHPIFYPQVCKISDTEFLMSSVYTGLAVNMMHYTYNSATSSLTALTVGGNPVLTTTANVYNGYTSKPYIVYPIKGTNAAAVAAGTSGIPVLFNNDGAGNFSRSPTVYTHALGGPLFPHISGAITVLTEGGISFATL